MLWSDPNLPASIREFETTRFDQLESAVAAGDADAVRRISQLVRAEYEVAHDGYRDAIARGLTVISEELGTRAVDAMGLAFTERAMPHGDPPQYSQLDIRDRVRAIAAGWHWHATKFRLVEDSERVTFELEPCGSGMRLVLSGAYLGDRPLARSSEPSPSNFMSADFPVYCNHCSEMTHVALREGSATFLVEGWTDRRRFGACRQHTYKAIEDVPAAFYEATGLKAPTEIRRSGSRTGRLFSDDELREIETHPLDRLATYVESGNSQAASEAIANCRLGWFDSIHDVYRNWFSSLAAWMGKEHGQSMAMHFIEESAPDLFRARIAAGDTPHGWASYWSIKGRLRDVRSLGGGRLEFVSDLDGLLSNDLPSDPDSVIEAVNRGLRSRGWQDAVEIRLEAGRLVHRWAAQGPSA
jgi:hypothetical protein